MRVYVIVRITMGHMYVTEKKIHSYLERAMTALLEALNGFTYFA